MALHNQLDWAAAERPTGPAHSAAAVEQAWSVLTRPWPSPLLPVRGVPIALLSLLDLLAAGATLPSVVIGMPVGFVRVAERRRWLAPSGLSPMRLEGSRGGAGLVTTACKVLLRVGSRMAENPAPPF